MSKKNRNRAPAQEPVEQTAPAATDAPAQEPVEQAAPTTNVLYCVGAKADKVVDRGTLQRSAPGFGKEWRKHGVTLGNTRHDAIMALMGLGATFSEQQAQTALAPVVKHTSGTPRSYFVAFCKAGYIEPATQAAAEEVPTE